MTTEHTAAASDDTIGAAPHERPVPRISVEVFHEFPDTAAAMQRAATDRRLSKANVQIREGGIVGAVEFFKTNPTPNLIIVETSGQGDTVLKELDSLAEVCDETTKVIVIGRANDVQLYRELVRRGVSEYLVAPLNPLQMIETISGLYVKAGSRPIGRVTVFTGARGGTGASTIAHNVAWYVAESMKVNTALIDLDLPFGTAGLDFNEDTGGGIADALSAPERLDDVLLDRLLIKCTEHLSLFASPATLDRIYDVENSAYEMVLSQVRNQTPCVVVDMPHAWTHWTKQVLLAADEIFVVAAPNLASLRNAKNMIDLVRAQRPNDPPPRLVLNQTGVPKRPEIPAKDFATALSLEPSLILPFDPHLFGTAANNGQMLAEVQPTSRVAEGIRRLAEMATGRDVKQVVKKSGFSRLPFLNRKAG